MLLGAGLAGGASFSGTDTFDNDWVPGNWDRGPFGGSGCQAPYYDQMFHLAEGRLNVASAVFGGAPQRSGVRWVANAGSYSRDWAVQVDGAVMDSIFTTLPGQEVDFGWVTLWLVVHDSANSCQYLKVWLDNFRYPGGPAPSDKYLALYTDNGPPRARVALSTVAATVRIRWSAPAARFTIEYDLNGATGGWLWTTLATFDVGSGFADWSMDPQRSLVVSLQADTQGLDALPPGRAWFDNFVAASAPAITTQPQPVLVEEGGTANFSVEIEADPTVTYVWRRNGQVVPGGNAATLQIAGASIAEAGEYRVTVSNAVGVAESLPATLTVNPNPNLPVFQQQPQNVSSYLGQSVQFSVQVQSATPVSYQWLHAGTNLPGRTNATLSLTGLTTANAGEYRVRVTNAAGSRLSQPAQLTVATTPPPSISYARIGPNLIIHWPLSATGFKAWTSESAAGPWGEHTGSYFLYQGNRTAIQANPAQGNRFFRIQK